MAYELKEMSGSLFKNTRREKDSHPNATGSALIDGALWDARFWAKVQKTETCWLWTASTEGSGYGQFNINGENRKVHRLSWEMHFGEIPSGLCVCHRCDVPQCVNPEHLFLGTQADNQADKIAKGRARWGINRGPANGLAKVKDIDAAAIITMHNQGAKVREMIPILGLSKSTIYNILNGNHWSVSHGI